MGTLDTPFANDPPTLAVIKLLRTGNDGPASAVIAGNDKLVKTYETGALHLYDLSKDYSGQHDLEKVAPQKAGISSGG